MKKWWRHTESYPYNHIKGKLATGQLSPSQLNSKSTQSEVNLCRGQLSPKSTQSQVNSSQSQLGPNSSWTKVKSVCSQLRPDTLRQPHSNSNILLNFWTEWTSDQDRLQTESTCSWPWSIHVCSPWPPPTRVHICVCMGFIGDGVHFVFLYTRTREKWQSRLSFNVACDSTCQHREQAAYDINDSAEGRLSAIIKLCKSVE